MKKQGAEERPDLNSGHEKDTTILSDEQTLNTESREHISHVLDLDTFKFLSEALGFTKGNDEDY